MRGYLLRVLLRLFAALSLQSLHRLADISSPLLMLFAKHMQRVTRINVERCFPELNNHEQLALIRANLAETGKTIVETGPFWQWDCSKILELVKHVSGLEEFEHAYAQGRGVIIAAPHLGAWELVGLYCSSLHPMTSLYRPPKIQELDTLIRRGRQKCGAHLVPTDTRGIRALYEALNRQELIGILPDQDPGSGQGVFAPFFGISANTMVLLSRLAMRSGAPVFFTYAERLHGQAGFHLHFVPGPAVINTGPLAASVSAVNAGVEACVRRLPHQYLWNYKRFKTRPAGEEQFY